MNVYENLVIPPMSDINECLKDPCGINGQCWNVPGSFTCDCDFGFEWDGKTCAGKFLNNLIQTIFE